MSGYVVREGLFVGVADGYIFVAKHDAISFDNLDFGGIDDK